MLVLLLARLFAYVSSELKKRVRCKINIQFDVYYYYCRCRCRYCYSRKISNEYENDYEQ